MARVVPFQHSIHPQAVERLPRTRRAVGRVTAVGAVLSVLSLVGSAGLAVAKRMESGLGAWAQARREREADRQLWALAHTDARLMAELVALQQHAEAQQP